MILKKTWIVENEKYYRTKIRLTLENSSIIYDICTDCNMSSRLCKRKSIKCMRVNYILSVRRTTYRYFPYAPEKKVYTEGSI